MNYYCSPLSPDNLRWEIDVVRQRLLREEMSSPVWREYRERLNELYGMTAPSATPAQEKS